MQEDVEALLKALWIDVEGEGLGVGFAMRAKRLGHDLRFWQPPHKGTGLALPYGEGLVTRIADWEESIEWADLVIINGNNRYTELFAPYFGKGLPILGANARGAELELDRQKGQEVLDRYEVETIPYVVVDSISEAIAHISAQKRAVVAKPWGGDSNSAMTFVADSPEDALFTLRRWEKQGLFKGQLMLQEKVEGVEIGISGMFGPHGWCEALEESFEHKRLMPSDYGPNTGEMGTVIRHVTSSLLFERVLAPLTPYLHEINYIGDISVNCIVGAGGTPLPLEFTARWGWPDFALRLEALHGDPVEFMAALVHGEDKFIVTPDVVVGVVLAHGDFPRGGDPLGTWADFPIRYADDAHLYWEHVKRGEHPKLEGGSKRGLVTAGNYVAVATARGKTVSDASAAAYAVVESVSWPSDIIVRDDIGERLREDLPQLQRLGYAEGMRY